MCLWAHPSIFAAVRDELLREAVQTSTFTLSEHSCVDRFSLRGRGSPEVLKALCRHSTDTSAQFCTELLSGAHLNRVWQDGVSLSLRLEDPRRVHLLPTPSSSATRERGSSRWPRQSLASPLWSESALAAYCDSFQSTHELLRERHNSNTGADSGPSKQSDPAKSEPYCPVVVIRRRTKAPNGVVLEGWDLIVPRTWSKVLWHAVQFAKAVAIGSEEMTHLRKCAGVLSFPKDYPHTAAGARFWADRQQCAALINAARPARKRVASNTMQGLLRALSTGTDQTRDQPVVAVRGSHVDVFRPPSLAQYLLALDEEEEALGHEEVVDILLPALSRLPFATLLHVTLTCTSRGAPMDLAELVWPLEEDYVEWTKFKVGCKGRRSRDSDGDPNASLSRDWKGHKLIKNVSGLLTITDAKHNSVNYEGRRLIGLVSSGQAPHLNRSTVQGLCDALALNALFRNALGKFDHPQAHCLILWRNPLSGWLRPAVFEIIG